MIFTVDLNQQIELEVFFKLQYFLNYSHSILNFFLASNNKCYQIHDINVIYVMARALKSHKFLLELIIRKKLFNVKLTIIIKNIFDLFTSNTENF